MSASKASEPDNSTKPEQEEIGPGDHIEVTNPRITVIQETGAELLRARLTELKRSQAWLIVGMVLSTLVGYGAGYWQTKSAAKVPVQTTSIKSISTFSNAELRNKALDVANEIRKFLLSNGVAENRRAQDAANQMAELATEANRQQVWQAYKASAQAAQQQLAHDWRAGFQSVVNELRAALQQRLGREAGTDEEVERAYKEAGTPYEIRYVMQDLESLAQGLLSP